MKKSLSFMFIFFMLLTMISGLFLVQGNQKVSAWGTSPRDKSDNPLVYDEKVGLESIGRINANYDGSITIQYKYGFSELMIVATECSQYLDGDSNPITNGDVTKAVSCADFGGVIKVIHVSGDYNRQASGNASKTIHLYNYVGLGKIVQVQLVFSFMKSKDGASDNTGLYYPLYCSVDNKTTNCKQSDSQSKHGFRRRSQSMAVPVPWHPADPQLKRFADRFVPSSFSFLPLEKDMNKQC